MKSHREGELYKWERDFDWWDKDEILIFNQSKLTWEVMMDKEEIPAPKYIPKVQMDDALFRWDMRLIFISTLISFLFFIF